jgi:hypothetical protein
MPAFLIRFAPKKSQVPSAARPPVDLETRDYSGQSGDGKRACAARSTPDSAARFRGVASPREVEVSYRRSGDSASVVRRSRRIR